MNESERRLAVERLRMAFDLHEVGVEIMRARLHREFPSETRTQIGERLRTWLADRPGAPWGDAEGRPIPLETVLGRP